MLRAHATPVCFIHHLKGGGSASRNAIFFFFAPAVGKTGSGGYGFRRGARVCCCFFVFLGLTPTFEQILRPRLVRVERLALLVGVEAKIKRDGMSVRRTRSDLSTASLCQLQQLFCHSELICGLNVCMTSVNLVNLLSLLCLHTRTTPVWVNRLPLECTMVGNWCGYCFSNRWQGNGLIAAARIDLLVLEYWMTVI